MQRNMPSCLEALVRALPVRATRRALYFVLVLE